MQSLRVRTELTTSAWFLHWWCAISKYGALTVCATVAITYLIAFINSKPIYVWYYVKMSTLRVRLELTKSAFVSLREYTVCKFVALSVNHFLHCCYQNKTNVVTLLHKQLVALVDAWCLNFGIAHALRINCVDEHGRTTGPVIPPLILITFSNLIRIFVRY